MKLYFILLIASCLIIMQYFSKMLPAVSSRHWQLLQQLERQNFSPQFNLDFRESKPKFLSPNSFSTMGEITPTTSLYLCGSTWESENLMQALRFIISENTPSVAQWMNKDRKHVGTKKHLFWQMCPKLQLYNLVDTTFRKTCTFNSALGKIEA